MTKIFLLGLLLAANTLHAQVKTGDAAPNFTLPGHDQKSYSLSQFKGKTVVLEWYNKDCPYVKKFYDSKTMQGLQKDHLAKGGVWLNIISSAAGKEGHVNASNAQELFTKEGLQSTALLLDVDGKVGRLYNAKTTPHMYIIDGTGKLVYQGAIDDRPSARQKSLEGATNYVKLALESLAAGQPIKTSTTTAYGCSVKY
jgi:AhpC/TSA family